MSRPNWFMRIGVIFALAVGGPWVMAGNAYFQQPDIHGENIVFCAERDLWTVRGGGGTAARLTTSDSGVLSAPATSRS